MNGILGTNAPLVADLTLIAYILLVLPAMIVGFIFARRRLFRPYHKFTMTGIVIFNWGVIWFLMGVSYRDGVAPNLSQLDQPFVFIPTIHLITGGVAQILGTYLVILMWTERTRLQWVLPEFLRIRNIKLPMRATLFFWLITVVLGIGLYLVWYAPPATLVSPESLELIVTDEPGIIEEDTLLGIGSDAAIGSFLIGPNGFTLYVFANDEPGWSNCARDCLEIWTPFTVAEETELTTPAEVTGVVATSLRADGALQVTYNDRPLYFYSGDEAPGDVNGHNIDSLWSVAPPLE